MRGLETGSPLLAGEALGPPRLETNCFVALIQLSLGRLLLSRACFCFTGQSQVGSMAVTEAVSRFRFPEGL